VTCGEWATHGPDLSHRPVREHHVGSRRPGKIARARIRLVIESVFSNPKRQMRLDDHLAKNIQG
jgi:hypothetical protein